MIGKVAGKQAKMSSKEISEIIGKVEKIEVSEDGKKGFSAGELKSAKEYLVAKGLMSKTAVLGAKQLSDFIRKLGKDPDVTKKVGTEGKKPCKPSKPVEFTGPKKPDVKKGDMPKKISDEPKAPKK